MDNLERKGKEYSIITESSNFKSIFGFINRKEPIVIYIKLDTWVNYSGNIKNYNENIDKLNSLIKFKIKEELIASSIFENIFFYTPELKKTLYNEGTKSHARFEITIKQKTPIITDINIINNKIQHLINNIISLIEKENNFMFSLTK